MFYTYGFILRSLLYLEFILKHTDLTEFLKHKIKLENIKYDTT